MIKRVLAAVALLVPLSFLAGCGGGGGGGGDGDVSVRPNVSSLQFSGIAGDVIPSQNISVELTNASGTVYGLVEVADPSVASAGFTITGSTSAIITVTPALSATAGTVQTTVFLRIYRNPNGTDLLASFSYPVTITRQPGMTVNPTSLSVSAVTGGATVGSVTVTLPPGVVGNVFATVPPGQSAPWLSVAMNGNTTAQVTASAVSLAPGVYQADIELTLPRPSGVLLTVRVPVTFTVGIGIVAPAPQTLLLDRAASLLSLNGAVDVRRADNTASAWTASSSAGWLVLGSSSGTTPGTLSYSIDLMQVSSMPQFADTTATVTLSAAGVAPVSFTVTLRKRLPYVVTAMPYGLPVGAPARIIVGGRGFNQLGANPLAALQLSGLNVTAVQVLSDTQLALDATPQSAGPFAIGVSNTSGLSTPQAQLAFSAAGAYAPATVPHPGAKNVYLHDPVRRAVFALDRTGQQIWRYQFNGTNWSVSSIFWAGVRNMALAPDGSRLWLTDSVNRVVELDFDLFAVRNTYDANFFIEANIGGVLPISSDGRLWLPGSGRYFDLLTRTFGQVDPNQPLNLTYYYFHGTLDGSRVLISPGFTSQPFPPWGVYEAVNGQVSTPMGSTNLWYEPRMSLDGSRTLQEFEGLLYDRNFVLLGQLPVPGLAESHVLRTLTPDGSKILVLRQTFTNANRTVLDSQAIDIYSTTQLVPGTGDFVKTGTLPITTDASFCNPSGSSNDCFYGSQYLLPSVDSKTLFWIGNQNMQVFSIP
jgi:hypothetical protein